MEVVNHNNGYRPDIDGLRAVAVLSVILFHINNSILPGGFLGVDIFFVISGYLITLHIFSDLDRHCFSLAEFYRRRIKRIAPAMLLVVAVTLILTQQFYLPNDAEKVAESSLWSLLSLANVYFWLFQDHSYFAAASNQLPLLHLWSLGVEEQFYIFWPLVLLVTHKLGHGIKFFMLFSTLAVISFLLGNLLFNWDSSFVYYMLPTRAGELLIGALTANILSHWQKRRLSIAVLNIIAWLGFLQILIPLFVYSKELPFPGVLAVPPALGAAMLIYSATYRSSLPSRFLSIRPLVWLGLISYSAYLWHWPLLAFIRYAEIRVNVPLALFLIGCVLILAWLSYRFVELPARHSSKSMIQVFSRQFLAPCAVLATLALVSMKIDGYGLRWFSSEYKASLSQISNISKPAYQYDYVCQRQQLSEKDANDPRCVLGRGGESEARILLWGDSNAAHYVGMIGEFAREEGFKFRNLSLGACPPLFTNLSQYASPKRLHDCQKSSDVLKASVNKFTELIVSANWIYYQNRSEHFFDDFFALIRSLAGQGKLVILLGKIPVVDDYDRFCRAKAVSLAFLSCEKTSFPLSGKIVEVNEKLRKFAEHTRNVKYYDVTKYFCKNKLCSTSDDEGISRYFDASHLTLNASWNLGREIYQRVGIPFPFTLLPDWPTTQAGKP